MDDLIYNQRQIPKDQWRYGFRTSADTGCGWIATHNALRLMGYKTNIEELIRYYEFQLPLVHGNAGTSFWGPAVCFRNWGFHVEYCLDPKKFDQIVQKNQVCILFYRWRKDWKLGAHFVALHKTGDTVTGYNTFRTSTGPDDYGPSLEAFVKEKKWFGCVLFGIQPPEEL